MSTPKTQVSKFKAALWGYLSSDSDSDFDSSSNSDSDSDTDGRSSSSSNSEVMPNMPVTAASGDDHDDLSITSSSSSSSSAAVASFSSQALPSDYVGNWETVQTSKLHHQHGKSKSKIKKNGKFAHSSSSSNSSSASSSFSSSHSHHHHHGANAHYHGNNPSGGDKFDFDAEVPLPTHLLADPPSADVASGRRRAIRRLMRDLAELQRQPIADCVVEPLQDNIFEWHGQVRSGAPIDLSLHFALRFSETYPVAPPKLVLFTNLPHPNVFARAASAAAASSSTKSSDDDGVGYYYACLDMLEASQNKPYLGWSSSYTVSAILLQIHAFLFDPEMLYAEENRCTLAQARELSRIFVCPNCPHHHDGVDWPEFLPPASSSPSTQSRPASASLAASEEIRFQVTARPVISAALAASLTFVPDLPKQPSPELIKFADEVQPEVDETTSKAAAKPSSASNGAASKQPEASKLSASAVQPATTEPSSVIKSGSASKSGSVIIASKDVPPALVVEVAAAAAPAPASQPNATCKWGSVNGKMLFAVAAAAQQQTATSSAKSLATPQVTKTKLLPPAALAMVSVPNDAKVDDDDAGWTVISNQKPVSNTIKQTQNTKVLKGKQTKAAVLGKSTSQRPDSSPIHLMTTPTSGKTTLSSTTGNMLAPASKPQQPLPSPSIPFKSKFSALFEDETDQHVTVKIPSLPKLPVKPSLPVGFNPVASQPAVTKPPHESSAEAETKTAKLSSTTKSSMASHTQSDKSSSASAAAIGTEVSSSVALKSKATAPGKVTTTIVAATGKQKPATQQPTKFNKSQPLTLQKSSKPQQPVILRLRRVLDFLQLGPDVFITLCSFLTAPEVARLALINRAWRDASEDGALWRLLFRRQHSASRLTPNSLREWKWAYRLECEQVGAELVCFHSKLTVEEDILGAVLRFTVHPKTNVVDWIQVMPDILSASAFFTEGVRTTIWNEPIDYWLPLYFTPQHFARALPLIERSLMKLSGSITFHPNLVLEVMPKIICTSAILISNGGVHASERIVESFCLMHRLFLELVKHYHLQSEVNNRITYFLSSEAARLKSNTPSLGHFFPLLLVTDRYTWADVNAAYREESMSRNVLWLCKEHPHLADLNDSSISDDRRISDTFDACRNSLRLSMFLSLFLRQFGPTPQRSLNDIASTYDLFYGRCPAYQRASFVKQVEQIFAVSSYPQYFYWTNQPCPSKKEFAERLRQAVRSSLRKGYHNPFTDFSKVGMHGVSRILTTGESYMAPPTLRRVHLEESWLFANRQVPVAHVQQPVQQPAPAQPAISSSSSSPSSTSSESLDQSSFLDSSSSSLTSSSSSSWLESEPSFSTPSDSTSSPSSSAVESDSKSDTTNNDSKVDESQAVDHHVENHSGGQANEHQVEDLVDNLEPAEVPLFEELQQAQMGMDYMDASCLLYKGSGFRQSDFVGLVDWSHRGMFRDALHHSGDVLNHDKQSGSHTIDIDLVKLPRHINSIYFVISSFSRTLKSLQQPYLSIQDPDSQDGAHHLELCRYNLESEISKAEKTHTSMILTKLQRMPPLSDGRIRNQWRVVAIGRLGQGRATYEGYNDIKSTIEREGMGWK